MSRRKRYSQATEIYNNFVNGGQLRYNPAMQRELAIERMYMRTLTELAVNRFKWSGLPDGINPRYVELQLFYNALAIFMEDAALGKIIVKGSPSGQINWQGDPISFTVVGNGNWYHAPVSIDEAVPIWANALRAPDIDIVMIYAHRLAVLDRTMEINAASMRNPKILKVGENMRLSMENVLRQVGEGQDTIRVTDNMSLNEQIEVLDFGIDPDQIINLDMFHTRQWGKCMGLMGIEFANQDKKERLVADEVSANNEQTDSIKFVNLNARRLAADLINKKFETSITVDYNTEVEERAAMIFESIISDRETV